MQIYLFLTQECYILLIDSLLLMPCQEYHDADVSSNITASGLRGLRNWFGSWHQFKTTCNTKDHGTGGRGSRR